MNKTPYLRMIVVALCVGFLSLFVAWSIGYWYDASTLSDYEANNLIYGKGLTDLKPSQKYFCEGWKSGVYGCDFSRAFDKYIGSILFGLVFLPIYISSSKIFYIFSGTAGVAFLIQLYFFKVGIKWKNHLSGYKPDSTSSRQF